MDEEQMSLDDRARVSDRLWSELIEKLPASELGRIRGLLDVLAGRVEPHLQPGQGTQGPWFMPQLPSAPWMDRAPFEELATTLEGLYPELRREALGATDKGGTYRPYGQKTGEPDVQNEWAPTGWDELRLWEDFNPTPTVLGMPVSARAVRAVVEACPLVNHIACLSMKPGVHLPPHHDRTNWYVSIHMGLVVPPGCAISVGGEERPWVEGKCIFFDNSFEHEAWNKGDARRIIFAVYLAHPRTTLAERDALKRLQIRYQALAALGPEATVAWARSGAVIEERT